MIRNDKKYIEDSSDTYKVLDKITLLQETRNFNLTPVNPKKCIHILTKILYMLNQGQQLTTQEATDIFFATTKLFQCKDIVLRRLVYLAIKELSSKAQDVIIVTSSLTKDVTGQEGKHRAAAIRALCSITDSTMFQAIERYMKQAIVDKHPAVSSAALVSAHHLSATVPDLVRHWVMEAQGSITSEHPMVSYHALAFVAGIRRNDSLSTLKLVTKLAHSPITSQYALCLLIRYAAKLAEDEQTENSKMYIDFIESCCQFKSEMVIYEAAHAIVNLKKCSRDLTPVISILQIFCGSSRPTVRLAGARTLAKLTARHPSAVSAFVVVLENLIKDPNRSVATIAATTLLATGTENSVERHLKQISSFMAEISDDFKMIVVQAIRNLCSKYPRKHQSLASFLAGLLRDQGGLQYKTALADALIALLEENPEAKETCLVHLCEFIEDCEHASLAVRILHILGREGPKSPQPSRYIRLIYNRLILESEPVRAAAISAVASFGAACPDLLPNIRVLLTRCQLDDDDEVRDRAVYYRAILDSEDDQLINDCIINVSIPNPILLEKALHNHLSPENASDEAFDVSLVPLLGEGSQKVKEPLEGMKTAVLTVCREELYADQLKAIPGFEILGPIFKTCEAVDLTEPETEYRVQCVKHIFARHLILQFECLNTLCDQLLEKVHIRLDIADGYKKLTEVKCEQLPNGKKGSIFFVLEFPENVFETLATFGATLEFFVRECDQITGLPNINEGYVDIYLLENIEIRFADQLRTCSASDEWEASWARAATDSEAHDTFGLSQPNLEAAAKAVCEYLGLPIEAVEGEAVKEIRGSGRWRTGTPVLVKARLVVAQGAITMHLVARSPREDIATLLLAAVS